MSVGSCAVQCTRSSAKSDTVWSGLLGLGLLGKCRAPDSTAVDALDFRIVTELTRLPSRGRAGGSRAPAEDFRSGPNLDGGVPPEAHVAEARTHDTSTRSIAGGWTDPRGAS